MIELDITKPQTVNYCIPLWLRDEQIRLAITRVAGRIQPAYDFRDEPLAVVNFGPSLNDTWEEIRKFKNVITCSGAHKFLVERGITPTWHVEVDPRPHKVQLIGPPCKETEYLIASACHQAVFDHLEGYNVKLWHVFDSSEEAQRILPRGEWAIMGGCSVGLRTLTIARFLGFTELHVFGMDGCEGKSGKHAAAHPMQPKQSCLTAYEGRQFLTTPAMLEAAKGTWHELNQMPDVSACFYGDGLVQEMAKHYKPDPSKLKGIRTIGMNRPELISATYCDLQRRLHRENLGYGVGGGKHAPTIARLAQGLNTHSVLDYGCGKGYLGKMLEFPIWEYDPSVAGKEASPRPADIVACLDVLEHIEPDRLMYALDDLRRVTKKVGYFTIHTGPSKKRLADGRNAHLIQQGVKWWARKIKTFFDIGSVTANGPVLTFVVGRKKMVAKAAQAA